ncbi:hypothetical protein F5882DRAFT_379783 [Hyaloscypha sp. PMI_1271]|nr:hypothetical protein F5882DRAFT_379783 [Hyaloscypha sp. PMI_1271]
MKSCKESSVEKLQEIMGQHEEVERLGSKLAKALVKIETGLLPQIEILGGKDSKCEKLWRKLEIKPRITQGKNIGPCHNYNQLMEKNKGLERDLENLKLKKESMKLLLDVGIAVRLRFLEQAKNTYLIEQRGGLNQITIREGNEAAHSANGTTDAALFTLGILKNEDALAPAFGQVYANVIPTEYLQLPELLRRAWDCFATLSLSRGLEVARSLNFFAKNNLVSLMISSGNGIVEKLQTALESLSEILGIGIYLLDRLEWLTVEIVEFDRPRSGGRLTSLSEAFRRQGQNDTEDNFDGCDDSGWIAFADSDLDLSYGESEAYLMYKLD